MPYTLEDSMRVHDVAFMAWLKSFHVDYADIAGVTRNNVPCIAVLSTPDRAHASITDTLVQLGWIAGATPSDMVEAAKQFEVLPMPFMTVQRLDPINDPELGSIPSGLRKLEFDETTQRWIKHPWPRFYYAQYIVSLWCKYRYTDNHMKAWVYSQVGKQGMGHNETLITVDHVEPWGQMFQRCRFDGSSDVSELEGERPRFIRVDYNFTLRMLVMHNPIDTAYITDRNQLEVEVTDKSFGDTTERGEFSHYSPATVSQSGNLWNIRIPEGEIPRIWPKDGNATVRGSRIRPGGTNLVKFTGGLSIFVTVDSDAVEIYERACTIPSAGTLCSTSFNYLATSETAIEITQREANANTASVVLHKLLPATGGVWKSVHLVALLTQPFFAATIRGTGTDADLSMVDIDVRAISQSAIDPTAVAAGDPAISEWSGLAPGLYVATATVTSGSGNVTATNDSVAPTQTIVQAVNSASVATFAVLLNVLGTSARVSVPATLSLAALSLTRYAGHQHANEV